MYRRIDKVSIRDFKLEDIDNKLEWINNPQNNYYLHYNIPLEREKTVNWFYTKDNSKRQDCVIEFEGIPIGLIGLLAIDYVNLKAEYYISMGDTNYKRRGIASVATRLILEYAFNELELNKVYLNVDADNLPACNLYEKTGFVCEGIFKQELLHHGHLIDRRRYAVLREDFNRRYKEDE